MLRKPAGAIGAALALFHGWLLVDQLVEGRLAEPDTLGRWLAGAALFGVLALAGRTRVRTGRRLLAAWLLAALLHVPALQAHVGPEAAPLPEASSVVAELVTAALLGAGLGAVAAAGGQTAARARPATAGLRDVQPSPGLCDGFARATRARPPPRV